jgi:hypothetical protein
LLLLFKESLIFAKQMNAGGLVGPALANSGKGCGVHAWAWREVRESYAKKSIPHGLCIKPAKEARCIYQLLQIDISIIIATGHRHTYTFLCTLCGRYR